MILDSLHYHIWTSAADGSEYANAVYENKIDAALDYLAIVRGITKNRVPHDFFQIEEVVQSLDSTETRGMSGGARSLLVHISRCSGGCKSPVWN